MASKNRLAPLLSATVSLELRTRICHWQVSGPNFRSLHTLFDDQAGELAQMADAVAERAQALGIMHLTSPADLIGGGAGSVPDEAEAMLADLASANRQLAHTILAVRAGAEASSDVVTASLSDGWLADCERRTWMLEASRTRSLP